MKKKIFTLCIILVFAFAASAFAATSFVGGTSGLLGTGTYEPSNGVTVMASTDGTGTVSSGTKYCATSKHVSSGTVQYGIAGGAATLDVTKIYIDNSSPVAPGTQPSTPTPTTLGSGTWQ